MRFHASHGMCSLGSLHVSQEFREHSAEQKEVYSESHLHRVLARVKCRLRLHETCLLKCAQLSGKWKMDLTREKPRRLKMSVFSRLRNGLDYLR
jgi:hypothetical protein